MKRLRPYIPIKIRLLVIQRQAAAAGFPYPMSFGALLSPRKRLDAILRMIFGDEIIHLDHDPALINRPFDERNGKYRPDANDPEHLVYRLASDHDIKTRVHGEGAQHSDLGLRRKNKKIARNRDKAILKAKIPARKRPWPKRKFDGAK